MDAADSRLFRFDTRPDLVAVARSGGGEGEWSGKREGPAIGEGAGEAMGDGTGAFCLPYFVGVGRLGGGGGRDVSVGST